MGIKREICKQNYSTFMGNIVKKNEPLHAMQMFYSHMGFVISPTQQDSIKN